MLPGTRTFSDDDVVDTVTEVLAVFGRIEDELTIPDDLRVSVYAQVSNMVTNRTITEMMPQLPRMDIPKGRRH